MGRLLLIDVLSAVVVMAAWFFYFARYNRRKGAAALHWVEAACSNKGQMLDSRWLSQTLLQARFGFPAHWFDNARVTIRLRPRPIPFKWFVSIWHKQKETLTFEADLDSTPSFHLDVFRHRWLSQRHSQLSSQPREWSVSRPGPGCSDHPHPLDPGTFARGQHLDDRARTQPDQRAIPFRIASHCRHGAAGSSLR